MEGPLWVGGGWVGGWLEELELKQALQFSFGLGLCNLQSNTNRVCVYIIGVTDDIVKLKYFFLRKRILKLFMKNIKKD